MNKEEIIYIYIYIISIIYIYIYTIRYGSRVSGAILGKESRSPLHLGIVAIRKGTFGWLSTTVRQLTLYIYIYIYMCVCVCVCVCVCTACNHCCDMSFTNKKTEKFWTLNSCLLFSKIYNDCRLHTHKYTHTHKHTHINTHTHTHTHMYIWFLINYYQRIKTNNKIKMHLKKNKLCPPILCGPKSCG